MQFEEYLDIFVPRCGCEMENKMAVWGKIFAAIMREVESRITPL
jgi:hypothetical protein